MGVLVHDVHDWIRDEEHGVDYDAGTKLKCFCSDGDLETTGLTREFLTLLAA